MTPTEKRLAEIYSYYLDECYSDDLSDTFTEWLATSMYGEELTKLAEARFAEAKALYDIGEYAAYEQE